MTAPISCTFGDSANSPADLLNNAAAICRFLAETAESFTNDHGAAGLSATATFGLVLILDAVENTINAAAARLLE